MQNVIFCVNWNEIWGLGFQMLSPISFFSSLVNEEGGFNPHVVYRVQKCSAWLLGIGDQQCRALNSI